MPSLLFRPIGKIQRWSLALVCLVIALIGGCGESIPEVDGIEVDLNDDDFAMHVTEDSGLVLVDFGASWCGPCREMAPKIAYLSVQYEGRVTVGKVDVDESPRLSTEFHVDYLPTVILFRGGQEVARRDGTMRYSSLSSWVDEYLSE